MEESKTQPQKMGHALTQVKVTQVWLLKVVDIFSFFQFGFAKKMWELVLPDHREDFIDGSAIMLPLPT